MITRSSALRPRVIVVGDVMTDVVTRPHGTIAANSDTPSSIRVRAGGSGANQAAWLATTGLEVHFVGCIGRDPFGAMHRAALERLGVTAHLAVDPTRPTGIVVALVSGSGERSMLTERGANCGLEPHHLPEELFAPGACLLLSGYSLVAAETRPVALRALEVARSHTMRICVDPASTALLEAVGPERFLEWTRGADLCVPNRDELRLLSGEQDLTRAADVLGRRWYGAVAAKLGADGAVWARAGEPALMLPSEQVEVVNTTGAGDAFCAGFVGPWLQGAAAAKALATGIHFGAMAAGRMEARPPSGDLLPDLLP